MVVVQPGQARGIGEEQRRIASERRYRIRIPVRRIINDHGVGDTRAIRRKCQVVFLARIVSQLNRLAVGKQVYENPPAFRLKSPKNKRGAGVEKGVPGGGAQKGPEKGVFPE